MGSLFSSSGSGGSGNSGGKKAKSKPASGAESSRQGARKDDDVTEKDRAVLELKNSRDKLKKYRKRLEADSAKLTEQAKALLARQQRDRALLLIKLKRFKENAASKIDGELLTVMEMIDNVEWTAINVKAMKALKSGNEALNKLHKEMSADDVAAILDETNEAIEMENQISAMLAGQLAEFDSAELEAELAALMGEGASTEDITPEMLLPEAPSTPAVAHALPEAPTHALNTDAAMASSPEPSAVEA